MSVAIKLLIERTEDAIAAATTPAERTRLGRDLAAYKGTLAAAHAAPRATRDPEAPAADADDEATTCSGCGTEAAPEDRYCSKCGSMLPLDDADLEAPDSPPSAEAVQGVIDRAVYRYAATVNGREIKPGDLSTFARSMAMRTAATRDAHAARVRAQIDARKR